VRRIGLSSYVSPAAAVAPLGAAFAFIRRSTNLLGVLPSAVTETTGALRGESGYSRYLFLDPRSPLGQRRAPFSIFEGRQQRLRSAFSKFDIGRSVMKEIA
jgi:hypothetical protein